MPRTHAVTLERASRRVHGLTDEMHARHMRCMCDVEANDNARSVCWHCHGHAIDRDADGGAARRSPLIVLQLFGLVLNRKASRSYYHIGRYCNLPIIFILLTS